MPEELKFAARTDWKLGSNRLINRLNQLRDAKETVLDLTESNPTRCGITLPEDKITEALNSKKNSTYDPSSRGMPEARSAIAKNYHEKGFNVKPEQIFLTASTSEAYSFLFRLMANPGDRVLVPSPSYPLFEFLIDLNDVCMDTYPLLCKKHWQVDFSALEKKINPDTKAIILVHPNNPTGSFIKRKELEAVNRLCKKYNLALICDEVFLDYGFEDDEERVPSFVENDSVLTFVFGGLSKCLGLPQMKLSWIVINGPGQNVHDASQRLEIILDSFLSVNTPSQNALSKWFRLEKPIQREMTARLKENRALVEEMAATHPECKCYGAEGGWYAVLKIPGVFDEENWVYDLLDRERVFVHPGYFFDFNEGAHIVLSLLTAPDILKKGLEKILQRL